MRSMTLVGLAVTFMSCGRVAAEEPRTSPKQEFDALVKAQREAQTVFSRAYQAATTKEEKEQAMKEFQRHGAGFAKLIQTYPNDPVALKAMD